MGGLLMPLATQYVLSADADEDRNALTITNAVPPQVSAPSSFMSRDSIKVDPPCNHAAAGGQLCAFDDQIVGVDAARLVAKMVGAGRLP